jgi:hypothetical protein
MKSPGTWLRCFSSVFDHGRAADDNLAFRESARVSRAGDGVPAIANVAPRFFKTTEITEILEPEQDFSVFFVPFV